MPTDDRTREAKIRERFEAWGCQQRGYPFPLAFAKLGSDYKYSDIRLCWRCWQAAYDEGREEGLEQAEEEIGGELYGHDTGEMGNRILDAVRSLSRRKAAGHDPTKGR